MLKALQLGELNIGWRRLEKNLQLMVLLNSVGILPISSVRWAATRLNVGNGIRIRA